MFVSQIRVSTVGVLVTLLLTATTNYASSTPSEKSLLIASALLVSPHDSSIHRLEQNVQFSGTTCTVSLWQDRE